MADNGKRLRLDRMTILLAVVVIALGALFAGLYITSQRKNEDPARTSAPVEISEADASAIRKSINNILSMTGNFGVNYGEAVKLGKDGMNKMQSEYMDTIKNSGSVVTDFPSVVTTRRVAYTKAYSSGYLSSDSPLMSLTAQNTSPSVDSSVLSSFSIDPKTISIADPTKAEVSMDGSSKTVRVDVSWTSVEQIAQGFGFDQPDTATSYTSWTINHDMQNLVFTMKETGKSWQLYNIAGSAKTSTNQWVSDGYVLAISPYTDFNASPQVQRQEPQTQKDQGAGKSLF